MKPWGDENNAKNKKQNSPTAKATGLFCFFCSLFSILGSYYLIITFKAVAVFQHVFIEGAQVAPV